LWVSLWYLHNSVLPSYSPIKPSEADVANLGEANGGAFGDYNGDTRPDLLVVRLGADEPALL
jgi:hypothetical protein